MEHLLSARGQEAATRAHEVRGGVDPDWSNREYHVLPPGELRELQEVSSSHLPLTNKVGLGPEDSPQGVLDQPDGRSGLHLKGSATGQGEGNRRGPVNQPGLEEAGWHAVPVPGSAHSILKQKGQYKVKIEQISA